MIYAPLDSSQRFSTPVEKTLADIRNQTGSALSLEEVMELIWSLTLTILPHDRIGLSFIDNDGFRVQAHYLKASYPRELVRLGEGYSASLVNSTLQPLLEGGHARIINNLSDYLSSNPSSESTRLLIEEGVLSSLTLPLKVEQRAVGFLFFSSRNTNMFSENHAHILLAVTDLLSQHLEKVWRINQLEESRKNYLHTLGFVSHEMKSPLASMMSVGQTYLKGYMGDVDAKAGEVMAKMMRISGYLINMVNNYLDLSRLESGEMAFDPKPDISFIHDILDFAIDTVRARAEERGTTFNCQVPDEDIKLPLDMDLMRIVAVNLLDNAVKYGDEAIEVEVQVKIEAGQLIFSVRNQGIGFTPEEAGRLFRRFSRLKQKGTEDRRGTGLGLYLSWWVVQQHGGHIRATSEPGKWATFSVTLPLHP